MEPSTGVHYLLVAGTIVVDEGKIVPGVCPGGALLGHAASLEELLSGAEPAARNPWCGDGYSRIVGDSKTGTPPWPALRGSISIFA